MRKSMRVSCVLSLLAILVSLLAILPGCGGNAPSGLLGGGEEDGLDAPGIVTRATTPNGLGVDSMPVSGTDNVMSAYYGDLKYFGFNPLTEGPGGKALLYTIPVGAVPYGVVATDTYAYVNNFNSNSVSVIEVASHLVVDSITVGNNPEHIVMTPDKTQVIVTNRNDRTLSIIDTATNTVATTVSTVETPDGITVLDSVVAGSHGFVLITDSRNDTIRGMDLDGSPGVDVTLTSGIGRGPTRIARVDGDTAVVSLFNDDAVQLIERGSTAVAPIVNTLTAGIASEDPIGDRPDRVAVSNGKIFVTFPLHSGDSNDIVKVVDLGTLGPLGEITVGVDPSFITANDGKVYVSNLNGPDPNDVTVINAADNSVEPSLNSGSGPRGVGFNSTEIYIANSAENTVSVYGPATHARVFVGPAGRDQGHNPPFGPRRAGILCTNSPSKVVNCYMADAASRETLKIEMTPGDTNVVAFTGNLVTRVWKDAGPGIDPIKYTGSGSMFPGTYGLVLVQLDSEGDLLNLFTVKDITRQSSPGYEAIDNGDGTITLRGAFVGIYNAESDQVVAPDGCRAAKLDTVTGRIISTE